MPDGDCGSRGVSGRSVGHLDLGDMFDAFGVDRSDRHPVPADRADRAQQFTPFAALRGYYELVRERERVVEPPRTLADDEAAVLSRKLSRVRRNMMLTVTHYDRDAYVTSTGMVTGIDTTFRTLTLVDTMISFVDIIDILGADLDDDEDADGRD